MCVCVCWEGEVGLNRRERKTTVLLSPFYFEFFAPVPFFNPSDEGWTSRSMLSQIAILLHHMCLTHGMAERRGVCRERSRERGEGKKMKSSMAKESGHAGAA